MSEVKVETPPAAATVRVKLCKVEEALPRSLIEMMKLAPTNPQIRASIMQIVGQMPPVEEDTFEKLKDWVEYNYKGFKFVPAPALSDGPPARTGEAFAIAVEFSESARGTCYWSADRYGTATWHFGTDTLRSLMEDAEDFDHLIDMVHDEIIENRDELSPDMERDDDTLEHSDYDTDRVTNETATVSRARLRTLVTGWLQSYGTEAERALLPH